MAETKSAPGKKIRSTQDSNKPVAVSKIKTPKREEEGAPALEKKPVGLRDVHESFSAREKIAKAEAVESQFVRPVLEGKDDQGNPVQKKLDELRRAAEERDAERRAQAHRLPYLDIRKAPVSIDALRILPSEEAHDAKVAVIEVKDFNLALAVFDPVNELTKAVIDKLKRKKYETKIFVVSLSGLEQAWVLYRFITEGIKDITGKVEAARVQEMASKMKNLASVKDGVGEIDFRKLATTHLLEVLLAGALALKASDIHFEAEEKKARTRYRLDGALHDIGEIPERNYDSLVSRIKLLSGLKINIHGEPQDGRFTIALGKKEVEMRVSIIPSEFGETVVMRVLDPDAISVGLNDLGLRPDDLKIIEEELRRPHGLILNTGPTGSGKTTTLYAFLRTVVTPEIKIITVEDPIEYHLAGVEQTQVNPEVGYTFAKGLRAIVRQDPDVILVGEIRDLETADIALQASLTGHMVLSTLHTNDAAGSVPRLIDIGAKPTTVGPALTLVIAQRLVRRLCDGCKKEVVLSKELQDKIKRFLIRLPSRVDPRPYQDPKMFEPVGCDKCNNIGYKGRRGIFEFFRGGQELESLILKDYSYATLTALAQKQGMVTMQEDGILKILTGITSIAEVEDVTGPLEW